MLTPSAFPPPPSLSLSHCSVSNGSAPSQQIHRVDAGQASALTNASQQQALSRLTACWSYHCHTCAQIVHSSDIVLTLGENWCVVTQAFGCKTNAQTCSDSGPEWKHRICTNAAKAFKIRTIWTAPQMHKCLEMYPPHVWHWISWKCADAGTPTYAHTQQIGFIDSDRELQSQWVPTHRTVWVARKREV